jgi:hypothetical protein
MDGFEVRLFGLVVRAQGKFGVIAALVVVVAVLFLGVATIGAQKIDHLTTTSELVRRR